MPLERTSDNLTIVEGERLAAGMSERKTRMAAAIDFANTFRPHRDAALRQAEDSAPDPDAPINLKPRSNPQRELRTG